MSDSRDPKKKSSWWGRVTNMDKLEELIDANEELQSSREQLEQERQVLARQLRQKEEELAQNAHQLTESQIRIGSLEGREYALQQALEKAQRQLEELSQTHESCQELFVHAWRSAMGALSYSSGASARALLRHWWSQEEVLHPKSPTPDPSARLLGLLLGAGLCPGVRVEERGDSLIIELQKQGRESWFGPLAEAPSEPLQSPMALFLDALLHHDCPPGSANALTPLSQDPQKITFSVPKRSPEASRS